MCGQGCVPGPWGLCVSALGASLWLWPRDGSRRKARCSVGPEALHSRVPSSRESRADGRDLGAGGEESARTLQVVTPELAL